MKKALIGAIEFLKTRREPSKMLDLVDEIFDQMSIAVQPPIVLTRLFGTLMGWEYDLYPVLAHKINEGVIGIATISDHALKRRPVNQCLRLGDVVRLPRRQAKVQEIVQPIHCDMDFGAKPATTTTQCLLTTFFVRQQHRGTCTIVLSIIPFSILGSGIDETLGLWCSKKYLPN